jgi:hypothetical protein
VCLRHLKMGPHITSADREGGTPMGCVLSIYIVCFLIYMCGHPYDRSPLSVVTADSGHVPWV